MEITNHRGQILVETLILLICLVGFFSLVLAESKNHQQRSETHRFSKERKTR